MASVSRVIVGIFAAGWLCAATSMAAPPERASRPAVFVDAFDVEEVPALVAGAVLQFSVFASPGAQATVAIEGVSRLVELREVSPGVYEGAYVIGPGDRLGAASGAVATVWRDGTVVRATLEESLVIDGAPPRVASPAPYPSPSPYPSPAAPPMASPLPQPTAPAVVPPAVAPRAAPQVAAVPPPGERLVACSDCAVVESIQVVERPSGPAYAGAIAGGIVGAVFGDAIGKAHEKHVTRVLGALAGAAIGHGAQQAARRTWYDAAFRLPNGALKVVRYDAPPPYHVGQLVRLSAAASAGTAPTL